MICFCALAGTKACQSCSRYLEYYDDASVIPAEIVTADHTDTPILTNFTTTTVTVGGTV